MGLRATTGRVRALGQERRSVTPLFNQADVVEWNTDKRYLADLEADGVAIVPTRFHAAAATRGT